MKGAVQGGGGGYFGIISRKMSLSTYLNYKKLGVANCYGNHSNRIHKKKAHQENFTKISPKSKFKNRSIQLTENLVKKPYSKFQAKKLKNVGCETFFGDCNWVKVAN